MSSTFEKENLEDKANFQQTDSSRNLNQKSKRPAQTLYIPKHMRNEDKKSTLLTNANSSNGGCTSSTNRCNSPIMNDPSIIGYITDGSKNQPTESISSEEDILNKLMTLNISKPMTNDQDKNYKEPEFLEHKISKNLLKIYYLIKIFKNNGRLNSFVLSSTETEQIRGRLVRYRRGQRRS